MLVLPIQVTQHKKVPTSFNFIDVFLVVFNKIIKFENALTQIN